MKTLLALCFVISFVIADARNDLLNYLDNDEAKKSTKHQEIPKSAESKRVADETEAAKNNSQKINQISNLVASANMAWDAEDYKTSVSDFEKAYSLGSDQAGCSLAFFYTYGIEKNMNRKYAIDLVIQSYNSTNNTKVKQFCSNIYEELDFKNIENHLSNVKSHEEEKKLCLNYISQQLYADAVNHCETAFEQDSDDLSRLYLAMAYSNILNHAPAEYHFKKLEKSNINPAVKAQMYLVWSTLYSNRQMMQESLPYLDKAKKIIDKHSILNLNAALYNNYGLVYLKNDEFDKATTNFKRAIINTDLGALLSMIYNNLALAYLNQDNLTEAKKALEKSIELAQENTQKSTEYLAKSNISYIFIEEGDFKNANSYLFEVIGFAKEHRNYRLLFEAYFMLSDLKEQLGDINEANRYYDEAKKIAENLGLELDDKSSLKSIMFGDK